MREGSRTIKVLHVINTLDIGGAEVLLLNLASHFQDSRLQLMIAYMKGNAPLLKNYKPPCQIFDLSTKGRFSLLCFFRLISLIRNQKVTILHTHDPQSGVIARIAAFICGVKNIITTRHTPVLFGRMTWLYRLENWFLRYNKAVVAISEAVRKKLIEDRLVERNKVKIIHNSIDVNYFTPAFHQQSTLEKNHIIIGSTGRLIEQKGFDILINAMKILVAKYPNVKLQIVGDGQLRDSLQILINDQKLSDFVHLKGSYEHSQIKSFLANIDIFVLPSRCEGFGISLIEAMAMKKPVIGSSSDGIEEIIEDGKTGLLFEKENPVHLASKLELLINNQDLQKILAENARAKVERDFSIDNFISKTISLYYSVLGIDKE